MRTFARLETSRGNASRNFLLFVIGFDTFDISVSSVYATYFPPCLNEGYIANGIVDLQSNNDYRDGFCIHSNQHVEMNNGNYLEAGVTVSMPNLNDFTMPASGFKQNDGLQEALRQSGYRMRLLNQMDTRFQSLQFGNETYAGEAGVAGSGEVLWPLKSTSGGDSGGGSTGNGNGNGNKGGGKNKKNGSSSSSTTTTTTSTTSGVRYTAADTGSKSVVPASFDQPNRIYQLECPSGGEITFNGGTYSDFALITDCDVRFSNGVILTGVIVATLGDVMAVQMQMGLPDNCAEGGGAQLWIGGDFKSSANFEGYGAQIIAQGDVQFPAKSSGTEGLSVYAGGRIDATSNADMRACDGAGMEEFQYAKYFRMVQ